MTDRRDPHGLHPDDALNYGRTGYLLIKPSEEGNPLSWLPPHMLRTFLDDPTEFGVEQFIAQLPSRGLAGGDTLDPDPNYWKGKIGLLLKVQVVVPEPSGAYRLPDAP